jgi:tight adherence protein C
VTPAVWGGVLGALFASGLLLIASRVAVIRRPQLAIRVLPYVRDLPQVGRTPALRVAPSSPTTAGVGVFGPLLRSAADTVERVLGGAASLRRRLQRADLDKTVHEFRVEQVLWGLAAFAIAAAYGVLRGLRDPGGAGLSVLLCLVAFVVGVLARDSHLTSQVTRRERRILAEFPTIAELLALAVAAGESPVAALDRVVRRSGGELSSDLGRVLAAVRTGEPVGAAFDRMAASTGLPLVARFAQGIAVAVERGRRELIEVAARREVLMMVPVVFLVLPITVLFAFWPGVVGLHLTTP